MRVISYDPYIPYSRFSNLNVERRDKLEDLLREADYITIHTPRTKETLNMISDEQIAMMKPGVRLVNVARGGLYNEDALYRGLQSGHIASLGRRHLGARAAGEPSALRVRDRRGHPPSGRVHL